MKIYVVRHGESYFNLEQRYPVSGHEWDKLTRLGEKQAANSAKYLKNCHKIYSSPAKRAFHTAEIISKTIKIKEPIEVVDDFRDASFGIFAGKKSDGSDSDPNFKSLLVERSKDKVYFKIPGGEDFVDVESRVVPALGKIMSNGHNEVAIVSHLYCGRAILGHLLGLSLDESFKIDIPNDSVYLIDTDSKKVNHFRAGSVNEGLLLEAQ